jgi:hypothetical protein
MRNEMYKERGNERIRERTKEGKTRKGGKEKRK